MNKFTESSASPKGKLNYGIHSAAAFIVLAALVCAVAVLFPKLNMAGRNAGSAYASASPAPPTPDPEATGAPDSTGTPASPTPGTVPDASASPANTAEAQSYVVTDLVIDGEVFASLASRQAAEELMNTAVSHFELLCPGTGLVTEIENRIEFSPSPPGTATTSFDEAFARLIGELTPLRVKTVFTRSDLEPLPCSSTVTESDEYYIGTRFVSSYGREGKKLLLHEYTYMNGALSSFSAIEESVLTEPVDEVVLVGTRPLPEGASPAADFGFSECSPTELSFAYPVSGSIVRYFGFYNGEFSRGIDIDCPANSSCTAVCGGTVSAVIMRGSLGLTVEINHGGGFVSRYAYLQNADVSVGDALIAGAPVGTVGSNGLHYELLVNGAARNPLYYLKADAR